MDYIVEYESISFIAHYTFDSEKPEFIVFAAQPFELLEKDKTLNVPSTFLIYGRIEYNNTMHVGFKGLTFVITDELHARIGELYKMVRAEFYTRYSER